MRPFGTLPRPRSRFQRPRQSWMWRIFQALQLRFGFLVLYGVIAVVPFWSLYAMAREWGYFYSTRERVALWKTLPDPEAISALNAIYENDSQGPVMVILRHYQQPCEYRGEFLKLWSDPKWKAQAEAANRAGFDLALRVLQAEWRYYRFENLLKHSDSGRLLTGKQLARLQEMRRVGIDGILAEQPVDESRVQALRFRIWGIFTRTPTLDSRFRQQKVQEGRAREPKLVQQISASVKVEDKLKGLRQLQVQTKISGVSQETARWAEQLAAPVLGKVLLDLSTPTEFRLDERGERDLQDDLCLLAHCQKLSPGLDYSQLKGQLEPYQLAVLESLRELSKNP